MTILCICLFYFAIVPSEKYAAEGEVNERRPFSSMIRAKIDKKHTPHSIFTIVNPNNVVTVSNQLAGLMKHKCTKLTHE